MQSHSWADRIGALVRHEYNRLFEGTTYHKRKVLAGVVVDRAGDSQVICLSTGTKCINGELLSLDGLSLNDCHAEVIVRRCLVLWLYTQLEAALRQTADPDCVLERDEVREGGFRVKAGVTFHLFISTAPCGDARFVDEHQVTKFKVFDCRIFSLHEQQPEEGNVLTGYVGKLGEGNRGKLRSKIESGMGTVPLPGEERLQTWDGVQGGERLLTMACSDKILRWNVLGLQGALLAHWLRPLYLSSVSLGSRFHPGHLTRALHGRLPAASLAASLPRHYRLAQPPVLATTSPEARQPSKAGDHSVNWVRGLGAEVVTCSTGRTVQAAPSRLCKRSLAAQFSSLCSLRDTGARARPSLGSLPRQQLTYEAAKCGAEDYSLAKQCMVTALLEAGCGR